MLFVRYIGNIRQNDKIFKFAKKEFRYHGTSLKVLPAILSEGLKFYPKFQNWNKEKTKEDIFSRESYPGIYVTDNLLTAISAARNTSSYNVNKIAIIGVEVETRTPFIVIDEDHIGSQDLAFKKVYNVFTNGRWYGSWLQNKANNKNEQEKVAREWLLILLQEEFPSSEESPSELNRKVNWLLPYAIPVIKAYAEVNYSFYYKINQGTYTQAELDYEYPDAEKSHSVATARYRDALEKFINKSNFLIHRKRLFKNEKIREPISYRGANKIVMVSVIEYHGLGGDYYATVNILYLSNFKILTDFIRQLTTLAIGKNILVKDINNKIYYDGKKNE